MLELNKDNFKSEVLDAKGIVLVDFWAPWCGPCRMQAPVLEDFAAANPNVKAAKVNVDENEELAQAYNIMSIPSLLVFKDGALVKSAVGFHSKGQLEALTK